MPGNTAADPPPIKLSNVHTAPWSRSRGEQSPQPDTAQFSGPNCWQNLPRMDEYPCPFPLGGVCAESQPWPTVSRQRV